MSELLIKQQHIANLHAGPTLLSHIIKQSYWIIGGKRLINKCINKCITCYKYKRSTTTTQLMGNLPSQRVTLERAFFSSGVDYAGPISIKFNKGRGAKTSKGYIALFVCLATKAVHIEAVSDLTTEAFIAAFRRFSARRGVPRHLYSDNAKNFVGASKKLNEIQRHWLALHKDESISHYMSQSSLEWHFIPPASPQFGGIWEAGIRSAKYHLKRVIGETLLTFEELSTLLSQIESILNSRPLIHVDSNDSDSINVLTPSHFLTGDILTSDLDDSPATTTIRNRWQSIQNMKKGFFRSWRRDYLTHLQQRTKWKTPTPNIKVGDVILLMEDNVAPGCWPLGRITQVHPGKDGYVRVVSIRCRNTILKRPIAKIALLPYQD